MSQSPCPVCSGPTRAATPEDRVTGTEGLGWENDSALEILGWKEAAAQLRVCLACLHGRLLPEFDAALLYGERAAGLRREVLARYPQAQPASRPPLLGVGLRGAGRELFRLRRITELASLSLGSAAADFNELRILDWGGGDGYLGSALASLLGATTNRPARSFVYEFTEWEDPKTRRLGVNNLAAEPPFQVLLLSHVLEHSHDPAGTLAGALGHLAEGGLAICEVPDERASLLRRALRRRRGLDFHVGYFSRRSLHRLFAARGLGGIRTAYLFGSSYRGEPISSILAVARKGSGDSERPPCRAGELLSAAVLLARKSCGRRPAAR